MGEEPRSDYRSVVVILGFFVVLAIFGVLALALMWNRSLHTEFESSAKGGRAIISTEP